MSEFKLLADYNIENEHICHCFLSGYQKHRRRWRNSFPSIGVLIDISFYVKMCPMLDLKRRPQPPVRRVPRIGRSGFSLGSLRLFYSSSAVFEGCCFSWTALLQLFFFLKLPSPNWPDRFVLNNVFLSWSLNRRRGDPRGPLPDASYKKTIYLGKRVSGKISNHSKSVLSHDSF